MVNISDFNFSESMPEQFQDICKTSAGAFSPECLYKHFCPQFSHYFINTGLWVVGIYVAVTWLLWAFWNVLYINIDWEDLYMKHPDLKKIWVWDIWITNLTFGIGDLREFRVKVYWEALIQGLLSKMLLGYIVVVIYLSM